MSHELVTMNDMERMAKVFVKSKLFGVENEDQAIALMLLSAAENIHPAIAVRDFHIIKGRHALKADAMLARFQQAGGVIEWEEYTDTRCAAKFSHPKHCPKPVLVEWTMDRAKVAGITGKDNWRNYPRQMLRARVISDGIKTTFPVGSVGVYTVEEVMDFDEPKAMKPAVTMPKAVTTDGPARPEATEAVVVDGDKTSDTAPAPEVVSKASLDVLAKIRKDLGDGDFFEILQWNNFESIAEIPSDTVVAELIKQFKDRKKQKLGEKK
jgi:hypothetical protein